MLSTAHHQSLAAPQRPAAVEPRQRAQRRERVDERSGEDAQRHLVLAVTQERAQDARGDLCARELEALDRFLLGDEVRLILPAGAVPSPGARFLTVAREVPLGGEAVVLRPTGVVEILEFEGALVRARVVQVLDLMEAGQRVVPLPSAGPSAEAPKASADDVVDAEIVEDDKK